MVGVCLALASGTYPSEEDSLMRSRRHSRFHSLCAYGEREIPATMTVSPCLTSPIHGMILSSHPFQFPSTSNGMYSWFLLWEYIEFKRKEYNVTGIHRGV